LTQANLLALVCDPQSVGLIALFVLPDNQGAIQLYEQLGWRRITSVPNSTPPGQLLLVRQHPAGK
jgi:ribosomal protein S18 acetylase RimI-like enzyme